MKSTHVASATKAEIKHVVSEAGGRLARLGGLVTEITPSTVDKLPALVVSAQAEVTRLAALAEALSPADAAAVESDPEAVAETADDGATKPASKARKSKGKPVVE